ncbi:MAG: hypothetical protein U9Q61_07375 [Thermodesulfobacteriota bacterium]|nr:hypothetical protein [Thermodesulfobacteriota bacterium]
MTVLQFLEQRFFALSAGDYSALYDSYHHDAPFRQQFTGRSTYIRFAQQHLGSVKIKNWHCLRQRAIDDKQLEAILVMEVAVDDESQYFYELALLIETDSGWCYHSAQKLGMDDYPGPPDLIDFCHFDDATPKIRF